MRQSTLTTSEAEATKHYGPSRLDTGLAYTDFSTPKVLQGYSKKILSDLVRAARLYNGRKIRIFTVAEGTRCKNCTNELTGERLLSNCPVCHGTGMEDAWTYIGSYWCHVDFGPMYRVATPLGNTESPGGRKEQIIVLGAPLLYDQTIIIFEETKDAYKIYDAEPHFVAMRGDVIAQIAQASYLSLGSPEYRLVTW